MLQSNNNLCSFIIITFMFWSWWTINDVVPDPQTNLLSHVCTPSVAFVLSNFTIFSNNVNQTFEHIREELLNNGKLFVTKLKPTAENPVSTLFQCRNYLSIHDCVSCFDDAIGEVRDCPAGATGGHAIYDGCFLRYEATAFFTETTENFNAVSCGNQSVRESNTLFTSLVQQVLENLQTTTSKKQWYSMAAKAQLPSGNNNGTTVYAFAQCIQTITQSGCEECLKACYSNMQICRQNSDGKAFAAGCFLRYSSTSFFPDNYQTIDLTPLGKQGSNRKGIIMCLVVGSAAFVLILLTLLAWIKRPKKPERSETRGDIPGASKLEGLINFNYRELKFATKSFSAENKLGEGGFGAVYKGTLKNGKVVAVKKLSLHQSKKVDQEFESEVKLLSNAHHRNLIRLLGCCTEGNERILIYEYMKNTSLDKFLFGKNRGSLNWKQRYDIMLGTAKGLAYLHEEFYVPIVHRDVKSSNILLDNDLQPIIADFGLARLVPEDKSHLTTKFAGTLGYTASEYVIHGQLSKKVDVYSYGIVILEIISGKRSNELKIHDALESEFLLKEAWKLYERDMHIELVDDTLDPNEYDAEEVKKIVEIGLLCTQAYAEVRPSMYEVMVLLQGNGLLKNMRPSMPILIET